MRPFIVSDILLLSSLPFSLGQFLFHPQEIPGCQYPSLTSSAYIYFTTPDDPNFAFSIKTSWTITYEKMLRKALPVGGFTLVDEPLIDRSEICDWKSLDSVVVGGIRGGDINYHLAIKTPKPAPAHPPLDTPRDNTPPTPSRTTLVRIRNVILSTSPVCDFALMIMSVISTILGISFITCMLIHIVRRINHQNKSRVQDIELSSINAPVTPNRSVSDLDVLRFPEQHRAKDYRHWNSSAETATLTYALRA
ncbi:hypothetical protein K504DRAFT_457344 [Pleomassaria siparia CBS 279.74]|uniref:Uncharacterized protein n=1 Tax=Pleomassaria siparia CBS 279.74 TaxID=1314801 RepID=A0A6G1KS74_9PLEO|nr:hypothetical protein K504DRAFT_457344 [Pleomassaria siparia CBS 279.74]